MSPHCSLPAAWVWRQIAGGQALHPDTHKKPLRRQAGGVPGHVCGLRAGVSYLPSPHSPPLALGCPRPARIERTWEGTLVFQTEVPRAGSARHGRGARWPALTSSRALGGASRLTPRSLAGLQEPPVWPLVACATVIQD